MKKLITILCLIAIIALVGCGSKTETASWNDGTYEGTGKGYKSDIKVEVVIEEGKIKDVKILSHGDTEGICEPAIEGIPTAIVEQQKAEVDSVTDASKTSEGIKAAVQDALSKAKK